jgi:DNA gyrase/topoisomerase IV subunit A
MKSRILPVLLLTGWAALIWQPLVAGEQPTAAPHEQLAQNWEDYGRDVRDWFARWWDRFGYRSTGDERPLISLMLRNREKLGLSDEQVRRMEQLRTEFEKESIRKDADRRVAEMDLDALLNAPNVDMAKVEAKVREIEKQRADLRLARIRAIEKAKEQLTADQRKKLQEVLKEPGFSVGSRPERKKSEE